MPLFSVIVPSFLGTYKGTATNREVKLVRAVKSVLQQTFTDFEIVIIADGCQKTVDIIQDNFEDERISLYYIKKQPIWSGNVRNAGIEKAKGEWICYLDIDDMFGTNHLQILSENLKGDWIWFNGLTYTLQTRSFLEVHDDINVRGKCGTSSVCHRKAMKTRWKEHDNYKHDWNFIQALKNSSKNYHKLTYTDAEGKTSHCAEYLICHLPNLLDV